MPSLGEEVFLDRLSRLYFETAVVAGRLGTLITAVRSLNRGDWMGRSLVGLRGHYPIYFTMRKN